MSGAARFALPIVVMGAALCFSGAHAANLQSLIDAHVAYVNGGFGTEEADTLRAEARNYPLELMFSRRGDGDRAEFVADVHLQIQDAAGRVIVDRASQGPIFLARLPDGQYTVSAEFQGRTQTRRIALSNGRRESVSFYWS
ncbi:MAG TPA: hypothetical protein VGK44_09790 [Casimicrobiaceae bacterium]|jgi:phosphomannomutase